MEKILVKKRISIWSLRDQQLNLQQLQDKIKSLQSRGWSEITFNINWEREFTFYGKRLERDKEFKTRMNKLKMKLKKLGEKIKKDKEEYIKLSIQISDSE
jgi:ABC-type Fe3+-hydroxamate transport system substrate-binding protein